MPGRRAKHPLADMKAGDSIAVELSEAACVRTASQRVKGAKFVTRKVVEGGVVVVRIWCVSTEGGSHA